MIGCVLLGEEYFSLDVTVGPDKLGYYQTCAPQKYHRRPRSLGQRTVPLFICNTHGLRVNITTSQDWVFQLKICEVIIHGQGELAVKPESITFTLAGLY